MNHGGVTYGGVSVGSGEVTVKLSHTQGDVMKREGPVVERKSEKSKRKSGMCNRIEHVSCVFVGKHKSNLAHKHHKK